MPNGAGLRGNGKSLAHPTATQTSTAQGHCIAPVVDAPGQYYLFSLADKSQNFTNGLYYSNADMKKDNGKDDIDPARKNILLDNDTLSEAMITVDKICKTGSVNTKRGKPAVCPS